MTTTMTTTMMMTTTTTDPTPGARVKRLLGGVRIRVVVGYVVLLVVALGISVLAGRQLLLARLDREIENSLAQETEELRQLATGVDPTTGQAFGTDVASVFHTFLSRNVPNENEYFVTAVDGELYLYSPETPPGLRDAALVRSLSGRTEPVRSNLTIDEGPVRLLAVPLVVDGTSLGTFIVAHMPEDDRAEITRLVRTVTLVGAIAGVVASVLAWSLAGRVLRPVRQLTRTAREIGDTDLSARIPVEGNDELAELGTTFNAMMDRLERGMVNQRRFLDDVAHELRTPITIVRGQLEVMGDDPAERTETLAIVTDELDRMGRYVSDLLVIAKAEQPDFLQLAPVDIGELMESMMTKVHSIANRTWVLDAAPPPGRVAVVADPDRLAQALVNLATNAVQHTEDGAEIGLGARLVGPHAQLWVRDTGLGIDPAISVVLFERTSRAPTNRTRRPDGTGLGLSIVAAIAEAHRGYVDVDSGQTPDADSGADVNRGATFTITIPIDQEMP
ncbi:MAG TPA: HAMP domain-containing sensor histidine kinase [Ilumatobacteraceae bacterium]|nr:HAMP domain-containing sensor histidine kinase [Ilumatobacteraceae bacterium]